MSACRECGEVNSAFSRFCHACGAPLPAEADSAREVRKTATIVFADLVEWTKLVERLDAESLRR